jgi:hypothetical protein
MSGLKEKEREGSEKVAFKSLIEMKALKIKAGALDNYQHILCLVC